MSTPWRAVNVFLLIGACTRSVAFFNLYLCGEKAIAPNVICMCRARRSTKAGKIVPFYLFAFWVSVEKSFCPADSAVEVAGRCCRQISGVDGNSTRGDSPPWICCTCPHALAICIRWEPRRLRWSPPAKFVGVREVVYVNVHVTNSEKRVLFWSGRL